MNIIRKANGVFFQIYSTFIGKQEVNQQMKLCLLKSVFLPTLYGSESQTVLKKHVSYFTALEMRYLRKIYGKTMLGTVIINSILATLGVRSVEVHVEWLLK